MKHIIQMIVDYCNVPDVQDYDIRRRNIPREIPRRCVIVVRRVVIPRVFRLKTREVSIRALNSEETESQANLEE